MLAKLKNILPTKPRSSADVRAAIEAVDAEKIAATKMLELQRARFRKPDGGYPMIGGFAQLTSIGPGGITTKCLKRWPDRFGERIAA